MQWVMVLLAGLAAQAAPAADPSLARIRERLTEPPLRLVVETDIGTDTRPKFRLSIEAVRSVYLTPAWEPDETIPLYVHTPLPLYHHEFLSMVTPQEFRASTLYPGWAAGPGLNITALINALSQTTSRERREARERRAREEVRRELERFKRLNGIP